MAGINVIEALLDGDELDDELITDELEVVAEVVGDSVDVGAGAGEKEEEV